MPENPTGNHRCLELPFSSMNWITILCLECTARLIVGNFNLSIDLNIVKNHYLRAGSMKEKTSRKLMIGNEHWLS